MTVTGGTVVTLTATMNDTRYSNSNGTEPVQNLAATSYYLDTPPSIPPPRPSLTPCPPPMAILIAPLKEL